MMDFNKVARRATISKNLQVPIKEIAKSNLTHLSTALTGKPTLLTQADVEAEDSKYIEEGVLTHEDPIVPGKRVPHRKYVQILSPKGKPVVRIENQINGPTPRVRSTVAGRLELEHIQEQIEAMTVVPDFGFPYLLPNTEGGGGD